ncbi:histidine kinase [Paenibacillus sp. DXFW5]|uniref:Histidine kinase n=1 Tax=Paenibacillus rhizolycopersici TaxID=2780073 RepID=A0ABS2H8Y0_9BACL|nr:histidine kinase [Paenibacillus rhizolycopersici]MBM6996853.1 histidine kinase [Paenibacillus rhizolycopersici]
MRRLIRLQGSVFTRFVAAFLLAIMPICTIGVTLYNWQIRLLDNTTVEAFGTAAKHGFNKVENELDKVKTLSYAVLADEDLLALANSGMIMDNFQKTVSMNRYIRRMENLQDSSSYILRIVTYIPGLNRVLDSSGDLSSDAGIPLQIYAASQRQNGWHFTVWEDRLFYVLPNPGAAAGKPNFTYLLIVELSSSRIRNELAGIAGAEQAIVYDAYHTYATYARESDPDHHIDLKSLVRQKANADPLIVNAGGRTAWIVNQDSEYQGLSLAAYLPEGEINPQLRELRRYFIFFSLAVILTVFILTYLTANLIKRPLGKLVSAFNEVERGNLSLRLEHRKNDEFRYIYRSFNAMVAKIKGLLEQVYEQKILAQSAELKQLQSQINPHFLYNSFFVIRNMARLNDTESVKRFTEYLAKYYQFMTQRESDDVRLAEEVGHSRVYADIQKMRFGERIRIRFGEVPPSAANKLVPRLILQPLVENVFEHGISSLAEEGIIQVDFADENGKLTVSVEDNGDISEAEIEAIRHSLKQPFGEVSGIVNIHKRLRLLFGETSGISVERSGLGGLKITLTIGGTEHV